MKGNTKLTYCSREPSNLTNVYTNLKCRTCSFGITYNNVSHYYKLSKYYYCYKCLNCLNNSNDLTKTNRTKNKSMNDLYTPWIETTEHNFYEYFPALFIQKSTYESRLDKFKRYARKGCACLSFYDFIRIYRESDIISFPEIEIPTSYVLEHINYIPLMAVARRINYYEFCNNDILGTYLIKYINDLSMNASIPIKFILESEKHLKWNWASISRYNLTFTYEQFKDLLSKLNIENLSCNHSILLEWIFKHPELEWDWYCISERLTYSQIKWLYDIDKSKLNWIAIANNDNITAEDIINNNKDSNVYPWEYNSFKNPTIEYFHKYNEQSGSKYFLMQSNRICIEDLIINKINITNDIIYNEIITYDDIEKYNLNNMFNQNSLIHKKMDQKFRVYYKMLYSNIIKELKFITSNYLF